MNNYYNWSDQWISRNNHSENLLNPKEGFEKGNMFEDLYNPYKNYQPSRLNPRNEKEKMLLEIQALAFAAHDLNLYLDIHPDNQSLSTLYSDYRRQLESLIKDYEIKYGPMTVDSIDQWVDSPWPWEVDNV